MSVCPGAFVLRAAHDAWLGALVCDGVRQRCGVPWVGAVTLVFDVDVRPLAWTLLSRR